MINLIRCEIYKLRKSKIVWLLFFSMLGLSVVASLSSLSYVGSPNAQELGMVFEGYAVFFVSLRDTPTLVIIGVIMIGLIICGDFDNRTIQAEISSGHHRATVLVSKSLSLGIAYAIVLFPYPVGRAVIQGLFYDFGHILTFTTIIDMLLFYFTIILVSLSLLSICVFLAFFLRRTVLVMGLGITLLVLGGNLVLSFGVSIPEFGVFLAKTPIGFGRALAVAGPDYSMMLQAIGVSVAFLVFFAAITYFSFRKAELK